jgi:radical SAM protein with 4Fe4S-binding SPASM domain
MNDRLKINPRVGWRFIGDEVVSFNCVNQQIVIWNDAASQLWVKMENGATFDELVYWLMQEYLIDEKTAIHDTKKFLEEVSWTGFVGPQRSIFREDDSGIENGEKTLLMVEMKAIENLIPFAITFETTHDCNEKCIHCYMDRNLPSLFLFEIKRILDEIAVENCLCVTFTGGEFFVRRDALEIIKHASSLHFIIDVLSNGFLINQEIVAGLADCSVRRVQISIYGATPETHDAITCLSGSFCRTIKGIELLKEAGIKVEIAFPLMNKNFHERHLVKDFAKSIGCLISPSHMITARNNGLKDTFFLRLDDEQLADFLRDKELSGSYAGRKPFQDHEFYFGFSDLLEAAPCYSGFNSCAITPSGKVLPCNQLLYEVGDLRKNTFSEIWHSSLQLKYLRSLNLRDLKECANCKLLLSCARCPGLTFLEGGNLLGPSPENCRVATVNSFITNERR